MYNFLYELYLTEFFFISRGRAELVDDQIYMMAPPNGKHQEIAGELFELIREHIKRNTSKE